VPTIPVKPEKPNDSVGSGDGNSTDGDSPGRDSSGGDSVDHSSGDDSSGGSSGDDSSDETSGEDSSDDPGRDQPSDHDSSDDSSGDQPSGGDPSGDSSSGDRSSGNGPSGSEGDQGSADADDDSRPDRPRPQDCDDDADHKTGRNAGHGHRSARRGAGNRKITVHIPTAARRTKAEPSSAGHDHTIQIISIRTAKAARSDSRRRSEVTERPQNLRPARNADRTHNSHRYQPIVVDRGEGTQTTTAIRAYRGSHRAERMHRTDDHVGAGHRSSRMGRHHTEQRDRAPDRQNRW
jgi:hypothetical protein